MNTEENIPEIITGIDCIQETKQHAVTIEHNWSINEICDLITKKKPGEKIESEQFSYQAPLKDNPKKDSNYIPRPAHLISTSLSVQEEILCDQFLNSAFWRIEFNKSQNDIESISINVELLHYLIDLPQIVNEVNTNLIIKFKFFLINSEMNEIFERKHFEVNYELKKFFTCLVKANKEDFNKSPTRTRLVDKFTCENFCKLSKLLKWLDNCKSSDFCLLTEIKIYNQSNQINSNYSRTCSRYLNLINGMFFLRRPFIFLNFMKLATQMFPYKFVEN